MAYYGVLAYLDINLYRLYLIKKRIEIPTFKIVIWPGHVKCVNDWNILEISCSYHATDPTIITKKCGAYVQLIISRGK